MLFPQLGSAMVRPATDSHWLLSGLSEKQFSVSAAGHCPKSAEVKTTDKKTNKTTQPP